MPRATLLLAASLAACGGGSSSTPSSSAAEPDLDAAEACVKTKVWEARSEGWALRSLETRAVAPGETWSRPLSVYPGVAYRVVACAEDRARDIDLALYDAEGGLRVVDERQGAQARLDVDVEVDRYVVVRGRDLPGAVGTAVGLMYR